MQCSVSKKLLLSFKYVQGARDPITNSLNARRSDEGLTLEMSTFESLYGSLFKISTQLIKSKLSCNTPHRRSTTVLLETCPLYLSVKLSPSMKLLN